MKTIQTKFDSTFAHWNIRLSFEDAANRRRGKIVEAGWAIWYLFGSNDKGDYLDYYACHRMTNDRHVRIYENGQEEGLPTIIEFRLRSEDPEEDKKLEAEYYAENQRISKLLADKGFGLSGDEPVAVAINRSLHVK